MNSPVAPLAELADDDARAFVAEARDLADVRADAAHALLRAFIPALAGAATLAGILCLTPVFYPNRFIVCVAVLATTFAPWWHRRHGRPLRGLAYLLTSLTLVLALGTLANGGPHAPAFVALFVVIAMAAWFISARSLALFVTGILALGLFSAHLLDAGYVPAKPLPSGTWYASIIFVIAAIIAFSLATVSRLLRQALEGSRDTANLMRSVFSAIDDTVILLDSNFAIADQKVNASYKARGFDSSYFERILDHDLGPAKGGVTVRAFLKRHLSVDQPQRVLVKQRHGYDKTYYHELTAAVLDASSGTRQGMVVVLRDVTQQETQRERLTHAQQMEAIGRLSSGIAHDFNNLITGIQSAAEFIREDIPEDVHEFLDIIVGSSERAALLTRRLLLHARKSSYDALESLKVDELIRESIGLLQRSLDRRVKLSTVFASPGMLVNADATLLQGIFLNLAINASQAMPEGGLLEFRSRESVLDPTTAAGVHHSLQAGKYAVIEVIDSGNGIPTEIQDKIFEPFFTTKSAGNGTGLGLSTAMDVLRRSGGYMTVKSVEGAGSTFTIYLPVVDGAAPSMERIPSDPTVVPSIDASIMVIDDEPAIRRSISLSLTKLGYHVESFRNGPDALTRLKTEVPDIIVLDMIMPGMSGRQVFDLIQQLPNPPAVIVTTGYAESDDIFSMLQRGLFSVVSKPYKIHELAAEIERALSNHQSSAALADSMRDVLGASHVEATAVVPRVASQLRA